MKKNLFYFTLAFLLLTGTQVSAEETSHYEVHTLEVGTEAYYYYYEEPNFMENEGFMVGPSASYTYHNNLFFRVEGRWAYGQVDYSSNGTGSSDDIDDHVLEFRGLVGHDYDVGYFVVTPYIGIGYRYLNDDSAGSVTTTGARGYERESNYFYSPLGVEAATWINDKWEFIAAIEYDFFWYGKQVSHLGDAVAGLSKVENDQDFGLGLRGSVKLLRKGEKVDIAIEPFIRYWHIDDSDISSVTFGGVQVGYGLEPENNTVETGFKISILF